MKKPHANFFILLTALFALILNSSCSKRGSEWGETDRGVKIFYDKDQIPANHSSLQWEGDTTYFGLAHGQGRLVVNDDGNSFSRKVKAVYGSMEEIDENENFQIGYTDDKNRLNGFGIRSYNGVITIGNAEKGSFEGYGIIIKNGNLYYKGNLKNNLPQGKGISFYPDGKKEYEGEWKEGGYNGEGTLYGEKGEIIYSGKWKKGKYNGFGVLHIDNGTAVHVWKDGTLDGTTDSYYKKLERNESHFTTEQYNDMMRRALSWERYHAWYYIAVWATALFLIFIFTAMIEGVEDEDPFLKETPWRAGVPYFLWLVLGIFGQHRAYLRSRLAYIYLGCFAAAVAIETRDICHYLFWPSTWFMWDVSVVTLCVVGIMGVFLLYDLFWIPWRVYVLNRMFYYADKYEESISEGVATPPKHTCQTVPAVIDKAKTNLPNYLSDATSIKQRNYTGKTNIFAKVGRAIVGNSAAVDFEVAKLRDISAVSQKATALYNELAGSGESLNVHLEQQRIAAKKNLDIVSHLFRQMMKYKNKKREVSHQDHEVTEDIKLDERRIENDFTISAIQFQDLGVDWESTIDSSVDNVRGLLDAGMGMKWSLGIGVGVAVVSGISDAVKRENEAREAASLQAAELVASLKNLISRLTRAEANMLRGREILEALTKANEAFTRAYIPVRDEIYGDRISFSHFIRGERRLAELVNDRSFMASMVHLKNVCVEYNKISNATIK